MASSAQLPTKFASRQVRPEFIQGLELVSTKVYPLPGAVFDRSGDRDPRLTIAAVSGMPENNKVCYYEHIATIRHRQTGVMYVVFRETMDALLAQQQDLVKFPKWLMNDPVKHTERSIYIHIAKPGAAQLIRSGRIATHQDWLDAIAEPWAFDSIAFFLLQNKIIDEQMYRRIK